MAAFERVKSGIPEMDRAFDNIRLGDNVVFRVSDLSQFRLFMEPYVEQAIKDIHNIIEKEGFDAFYVFDCLSKYSPEMLNAFPDRVREFAGGEELSDIVHVFDVSGADCTAISDMASGRLMITL